MTISGNMHAVEPYVVQQQQKKEFMSDIEHLIVKISLIITMNKSQPVITWYVLI